MGVLLILARLRPRTWVKPRCTIVCHNDYLQTFRKDSVRNSSHLNWASGLMHHGLDNSSDFESPIASFDVDQSPGRVRVSSHSLTEAMYTFSRILFSHTTEIPSETRLVGDTQIWRTAVFLHTVRCRRNVRFFYFPLRRAFSLLT